jgi:hypothetical protein
MISFKELLIEKFEPKPISYGWYNKELEFIPNIINKYMGKYNTIFVYNDINYLVKYDSGEISFSVIVDLKALITCL